MSDCIPVSFVRADLGVFCGLDKLGVKVEGMREDPPMHAGHRPAITLSCRPMEQASDRFCRSCGTQGTVRDTRWRTFSHLPFGERPTMFVSATVAIDAARVRVCGPKTQHASLGLDSA